MTVLRPLAVAMAVLATGALSGCNPFESKLIGLCEVVLKDRLAAPSGYRRIEASQFMEQLSTDDYRSARMRSIAKEDGEASRTFDTNGISIDLAAAKAAGKAPARLVVLLTYDAPNAFGAPLRLRSTCEYVSADGTIDRATEYNVAVDGMTKSESFRDRIRRSREIAD